MKEAQYQKMTRSAGKQKQEKRLLPESPNICRIYWRRLIPPLLLFCWSKGLPWISFSNSFWMPLAALILVTVLRHVFHAPRPYDQMNYYPLISHKPGNSFPSRHTASSVIIAMAFGMSASR